MLTPKQQALWKKTELDFVATMEREAAELIRATDGVKPLIEAAIGGWENADRVVIGYLMAVGELQSTLKVLEEHRTRFASAMARSDSPKPDQS